MCSAWPPSAKTDEQIVKWARKVADWGRFEELVHHHRVRPLVSNAMRRIPVDVPKLVYERIAASSIYASSRALILARESIELERLLSTHKISSLTIKGSALAGLCYPSITLKESWDIDLLVGPHDACAARQLLIDAGYTAMNPQLSSGQFKRFVPHWKEAAFYSSTKQITVELHWRLTDSCSRLNSSPMQASNQRVPLPFGTVSTLNNEQMFSYLCLHGASHNWFRLKWLADLNAFVSCFSEQELEKLYQASRSYGAHRSASVALRLCRRLFGFHIPVEIEKSLEQSLICSALEKNSLSTLGFAGSPDSMKAERSLWCRSMAASFFIVPGLTHFATHALLYWNSALDRAQIPIPRRLSFVYHFLRLPLWIGRVGRRLTARRRARG